MDSEMLSLRKRSDEMEKEKDLKEQMLEVEKEKQIKSEKKLKEEVDIKENHLGVLRLFPSSQLCECFAELTLTPPH